jgi:small subunit ribosomal protein S1
MGYLSGPSSMGELPDQPDVVVPSPSAETPSPAPAAEPPSTPAASPALPEAPHTETTEGAAAETATAATSSPSASPHRAPKKRRDDRKAPIVFRKPVAGEKQSAGATGQTSTDAGDATNSPAGAEAVAAKSTRPKRERRGSEKVFRRTETTAEAEAAKAAAEGKLAIGQKVGGRISELGDEMAKLDLGNSHVGIIDVKELRDADTKLDVVLGAEVEGVIISINSDGNEGVVTRVLSPGGRRDELYEAKRWNADVSGLVTGHNKGGLEVVIYGMRGFCPTSQVELRPVRDLTPYIGRRMKFRVLEVREREVVLSHRGTLEEEAKKLAEEVRKQVVPGAKLEGTVTSLKDFGAFLDLGGGVEGMIHLTELSHGHIKHPKDALKVGQVVTVQVLRVDPPKEGDKHERIALSLKALSVDPWTQAAAELTEGKHLKAKVARLQPFGAFVELFPGVDGLIHVSAMGQRKRIEHPKEVVQVGQEVEVVVEGVDQEQKRIKLRLVTPEGEGDKAEHGGPRRDRPAREGSAIDVTVDRVEPSGVAVKWEGGRGFVPNNETGLPKGTDLRKRFPPGMTFKAKVLEVDREGRYKLSKQAADRDEERRSVRDYLRGEQKKMKGFGTLGDLMKLKK